MGDPKPKKYLTYDQALQKLQRYCAYQDRCHQEVRSKLIELGVYGDTLEEIIVELITENFLNEERYARSFARGKFRIKTWGRLRIKQELKKRGISPYLIRKAMEEIDEEDYQSSLKDFLERKNQQLRETDDYKRRQKLAAFAFRRGFESELVWEVVNNL